MHIDTVTKSITFSCPFATVAYGCIVSDNVVTSAGMTTDEAGFWHIHYSHFSDKCAAQRRFQGHFQPPRTPPFVLLKTSL